MELEILKELQRICEKHSLRYYLLGGSALGAVRHQGFIPWDDDVDVGMPRPDYDAFCSLCSTELDDRYFWQTLRTERYYSAIFGKLRANGTEMVEEPTAHLPIHHGVYIDVFPLDGTPRNPISRYLHLKTIRLCIMSLSAGTKRMRPETRKEKIARFVPHALALTLYERTARRYLYDASDVVINLGGSWGFDREAAPREWFAEGKELLFEGEPVMAPKRWHEYLTRVYGDYMCLPPESERGGRHYVARVGLGEDRGAAKPGS